MRKHNINKLYWLNPIGIYAFWMLLMIYTYTIPNKNLITLFETPNFVSFENVLVYLLFFIVFCLGCFSASNSGFGTYKINESKEIKTYKLLFIIYFFANVIWYINLGITYGGNIYMLVLSNLTGYYNMFKVDGGHISGITTFTEIGIVVAPYGYYLWRKTRKKWILKSLVCLFFLNTLRALIFAERIAILNTFIPCFAIFILFYRGRHWNLIKYIPIFAIVILFVFFGIFEYFRSWLYYKDIYDGSFVTFIIDRVFVGYYSLSINNECLYMNKGGLNYFPNKILEWVWLLPGLSSIRTSFMPSYGDLLGKYANQEFNNFGGLLSCYTDLGFFGLLPQFVFGYIMYKSYKGFLYKRYMYTFIYAISIYALLELPRYFFWGSNRSFFVFIGLAIIRYNVLKKVKI